jgi:hypothetical protein
MVINKTGLFTVKIAKNIANKNAKEQEAILDQFPPKVKPLVRYAQRELAKKARRR